MSSLVSAPSARVEPQPGQSRPVSCLNGHPTPPADTPSGRYSTPAIVIHANPAAPAATGITRP